jgi:transketolase
MRKQFVETFESIVENDPNIVMLLGDIGVFGFRNSLKKFPERVYNIGILEQSTVGLAAGLSRAGLIPIIHTIAPFLVERAYEQIKIDFGYQKLGCNLVSVGASYDYAALGCTHHCPGDVAILQNIPGLEIIIPGTKYEFDTLFRQTYDNGKPTYHRLSERSNNENNEVIFGKANIIKKGKKATVIAIGPVLDMVLEATENLEVDIIYYTTIMPFDYDTLMQNLQKKNKILVIEPFYVGTMTHLIMNHITHPVSICSIGVPREFLRKYGNAKEHDLAVGLNTNNIKNKINEMINE